MIISLYQRAHTCRQKFERDYDCSWLNLGHYRARKQENRVGGQEQWRTTPPFKNHRQKVQKNLAPLPSRGREENRERFYLHEDMSIGVIGLSLRSSPSHGCSLPGIRTPCSNGRTR